VAIVVGIFRFMGKKLKPAQHTRFRKNPNGERLLKIDLKRHEQQHHAGGTKKNGETPFDLIRIRYFLDEFSHIYF
jgi:hypothetical protein